MRRWVVFAAVLYLISLALILWRNGHLALSGFELLVLYPLIGAFVLLVIIAAVFELLAIALPFVLDTLRFLAPKVLGPQRGDKAAEWMTTRWRHAPDWMRNASPWMKGRTRDGRFR